MRSLLIMMLSSLLFMTPVYGQSLNEEAQGPVESIATQVPRALRGEVVDFPVNMPSVKVLPTSPVRHYTTLVEKMGMFSSQFLDFQPNQLEIKYRGSLAKWDTSLLRLCFLNSHRPSLRRRLINLAGIVRPGRIPSFRAFLHAVSNA